ncbi:MAG: hypothetical protein R2750_01470 [Bacteroidales bacterium]
MNWEELLCDSSRNTIMIAVKLIEENPKLYNNFFDFSMIDNGVYGQRSGRVIHKLAEKNPEQVKPYISAIARKITVAKSEGLRRSFLRVLMDHYNELEEDDLGLITEACFRWVVADEKPAIKIYSLEILYRISNLYPDLKPELMAVIESIMPHESKGIKSRGRKMIKVLSKEINI